MNESRIDQEIAIRAPTARVFRALTEAGELERWWTTRAMSEPGPGGRFRYEWTFAGAPERDHVQEGMYSTFDTGGQVSYPWRAAGAETEVAFSLHPDRDRTLLRLVHRGWKDGMEDAREHHAQGWGFFLENLRAFLEDGVDRRAEVLGLDVRG